MERSYLGKKNFILPEVHMKETKWFDTTCTVPQTKQMNIYTFTLCTVMTDYRSPFAAGTVTYLPYVQRCNELLPTNGNVTLLLLITQVSKTPSFPPLLSQASVISRPYAKHPISFVHVRTSRGLEIPCASHKSHTYTGLSSFLPHEI
jgi:hypothetical protein